MKKVFCRTCGGAQEVDESKSEFVCEYCGLTQRLERELDSKANSILDRANSIRHLCDFERAKKTYEILLNQDPTIAEANFGMFLCNYGVEYVDDPKTGKKIPTCHLTNGISVSKDPSYQAALKYADELTKKHYEEEGKKIEALQKDILKICKSEKPYDVFISYKETDKNGERTEDSSLAFNIYSALTEKGYRTFYSRETLKGKLGVEYEPYIYNALSTAKVMVLIGTSKENMESIWVKNEWNRFLKMAEKDKNKVIIPCYKDFEAYDLPDELVNYQAADIADIAFNNELVHNIEKLFDKFDDDIVDEKKAKRSLEKEEDILLKRDIEKYAYATEMTDSLKSLYGKILKRNKYCFKARFRNYAYNEGISFELFQRKLIEIINGTQDTDSSIEDFHEIAKSLYLDKDDNSEYYKISELVPLEKLIKKGECLLDTLTFKTYFDDKDFDFKTDRTFRSSESGKTATYQNKKEEYHSWDRGIVGNLRPYDYAMIALYLTRDKEKIESKLQYFLETSKHMFFNPYFSYRVSRELYELTNDEKYIAEGNKIFFDCLTECINNGYLFAIIRDYEFDGSSHSISDGMDYRSVEYFLYWYIKGKKITFNYKDVNEYYKKANTAYLNYKINLLVKKLSNNIDITREKYNSDYEDGYIGITKSTEIQLGDATTSMCDKVIDGQNYKELSNVIEGYFKVVRDFVKGGNAYGRSNYDKNVLNTFIDNISNSVDNYERTLEAVSNKEGTKVNELLALVRGDKSKKILSLKERLIDMGRKHCCDEAASKNKKTIDQEKTDKKLKKVVKNIAIIIVVAIIAFVIYYLVHNNII